MTLLDIARKIRQGEDGFDVDDWIFIKGHPSYFNSDTDCKIISIKDPWCTDSKRDFADQATEGYSTKFDYEYLLDYPFQLRRAGLPDNDNIFFQTISHLSLIDYWPTSIPEVDLRPIPDIDLKVLASEPMNDDVYDLISKNLSLYKRLERNESNGNVFADHFSLACRFKETAYNLHEFYYLRWKTSNFSKSNSLKSVSPNFAQCPRCGEITMRGRICGSCLLYSPRGK